ncbi:MAG TPA: TetR/AcrR family transcriptional regulator C-terminal domain-containing protein, partial [Magnetovibrio sp.]
IALVSRSVMAELGPVFNDKSATGAKRLERLVHAHLAFIQKNRGIPALLFSDTLHQGSPVLKAEVRQLMKGYAGRVAGLVLEGVEDGSITAATDPALLAQTIVTLVQGVVLRWSLFDHAFDLETQADVIWTVVQPALVKP